MDRLIIKEIEFIGHCGITEAERSIGQKISADIEMVLEISKAASSDRLEDTVNYVEICDTVVSIGRQRPYNLLETLAVRISKEILESYPIAEIVVRLRKCSVPVDSIKGHFAVEITRRASKIRVNPHVPHGHKGS